MAVIAAICAPWLQRREIVDATQTPNQIHIAYIPTHPLSPVTRMATNLKKCGTGIIFSEQNRRSMFRWRTFVRARGPA